MSQSEVKGETVEVTTKGVLQVFRRRIEQLLTENGIDPVEADEWYPLDDFLEVLVDIQHNTGENALNKIGEATPVVVSWPSDPGSVLEALESLNKIYSANHRNAPGTYDATEVDDGTVRITTSTPYPCAFDKGLLKGTAENFGASYATVTEVGDGCRADGGNECVYEVTW